LGDIVLNKAKGTGLGLKIHELQKKTKKSVTSCNFMAVCSINYQTLQNTHT